VAIEETSSSFEDQPTQVRARRAAVMAGVGLVWAAFMASIGFFWLAGIVLVAFAIGVGWALGPNLPRYDLRGGLRRAAGSTRSGASRFAATSATGLSHARTAGLGAARRTSTLTRRAARSAGTAGRRGSRTAAAASRTAGGRALHGARRLSHEAQQATRSGIRTAIPTIQATAERAASAAASAKTRLERPPTTEAPHLVRESTLLRRQGRITEAVETAEEAVAQFDTVGDDRGRALAANALGLALTKAGRHAEAIDAFDTALITLAEIGDRHHEGQVLANLGTVHQRVGGTEAARFCWSKALERLEPGTPESERTAELLGVR
jgi:tetratricopeptide (TPR) repeat protein